MSKVQCVTLRVRNGFIVVKLTCECCQGAFKHKVRIARFCGGACRVAAHRAYHMTGGAKRGKEKA